MKKIKSLLFCFVLCFIFALAGGCASSNTDRLSMEFNNIKKMEEYKLSFFLMDQSEGSKDDMHSPFYQVDGINVSVQGKLGKEEVDLQVDILSSVVSLQSILKIDHDKYDFLGNRYTNEQMQTKNTISTDNRITYIHDFKYIFSEFVKKMIARIVNDKLELADSTIKLLNEDAIEVQSYTYHFDEEQLKSFAVDFLKMLKSEEGLNMKP